MSEPTFQIVFRGKILGGFDRNQVRQNLAQLFKSDPARIDAILDAPKTVLKTGASKEVAARYQEALRQAGIMVAVIGDAPALSPAPAAVSTPQAAATPPAAKTPPAPAPAPSVTTTQAAIPIAAMRAGGLSLALPGERILPPVVRKTAQIDTSGLSLAQSGTPLVEHRPIPEPQFDLSHMRVATDNSPIDNSPKPAPLVVDLSKLSLAEVQIAPEKAPTELHKLLSSAVD